MDYKAYTETVVSTADSVSKQMRDVADAALAQAKQDHPEMAGVEIVMAAALSPDEDGNFEMQLYLSDGSPLGVNAQLIPFPEQRH